MGKLVELLQQHWPLSDVLKDAVGRCVDCFIGEETEDDPYNDSEQARKFYESFMGILESASDDYESLCDEVADLLEFAPDLCADEQIKKLVDNRCVEYMYFSHLDKIANAKKDLYSSHEMVEIIKKMSDQMEFYPEDLDSVLQTKCFEGDDKKIKEVIIGLLDAELFDGFHFSSLVYDFGSMYTDEEILEITSLLNDKKTLYPEGTFLPLIKAMPHMKLDHYSINDIYDTRKAVANRRPIPTINSLSSATVV